MAICKKKDPKAYAAGVANSAKLSLGGLSSKLEKRREKLRQMKDDAMNIDKEASKATEKKE